MNNNQEELTEAQNGSRMIRDMSIDQRPRERAIQHGVGSLSDTELMAIIFSTGIKGKSVIELSQDILNDNAGHLSRVARLSVRDFLNRYKGIGPAKAITLLAALELGKRSALDGSKLEIPSVKNSQDAYKLMKHHFVDLNHEEFWVMMLSQAGKVIREAKISQGGVAATTVDVKLIMKEAISELASAIIVFHNHPSGQLRPSGADDSLTDKIVKAGKLLDIRVNDHIIVTSGGYYSYVDENRL
jgi:DNA repair protein RadC